MLTPVTTGVAFKLNEKKSDPLAMYLNDLYTLSPSLAGIPGVSVNAGFSKAGLPIGVQILGRHFDEAKAIQAAYTIESFAGVKGRLPNEI